MRIGCSIPGYSGYDSIALERRLRTHALDLELGHEHHHLAPGSLCANTTGRSVERKPKPVKYWMYDASNRT